MRPLSKAFYLGPMMVGWLLFFVALSFLMVVFIMGRGSDRELVPLLMLPALLPAMLCSTIPMLVFMYKAWSSIQDASPRTGPLAAILLLFVPFYNLYWIFHAYWGWTKDFNRHASMHPGRIAHAPEGIAFAICILILLSGIPFVGALFAMANLVLALLFVNYGINSVNSLIEARAKAKLA